MAQFYGIGRDAPQDAPQDARYWRMHEAAEMRALERELTEKIEMADLQARIANLKARLAQPAAAPARVSTPPRVDVPRAKPPISSAAFRGIAPAPPVAPRKRGNPLSAMFARPKATPAR